MADKAAYSGADFNSLRWFAVGVTPNDGADLARPAAAITCVGEGTISVITSGGDTVTLFCQAGGILPVVVDRVRSTGTDATGIVALYQ
jgi:hypothetical protein